MLQRENTGGYIQASKGYSNLDSNNHYKSSVLIDDYLHSFFERFLTAMNFATGEVAWRDRSVGKGHIIHADGRLDILGEQSMGGPVDPDPCEYREVSRFEIGSADYPIWTLPVLADGRLYLRDQDRL